VEMTTLLVSDVQVVMMTIVHVNVETMMRLLVGDLVMMMTMMTFHHLVKSLMTMMTIVHVNVETMMRLPVVRHLVIQGMRKRTTCQWVQPPLLHQWP
jgi:hypothetical protein